MRLQVVWDDILATTSRRVAFGDGSSVVGFFSLIGQNVRKLGNSSHGCSLQHQMKDGSARWKVYFTS